MDKPIPAPSITDPEGTPAAATRQRDPQWIVLLAPLTVSPRVGADEVFDAGRIVRVGAARAKSLIDGGRARLASEADLAIGAAQARDISGRE